MPKFEENQKFLLYNLKPIMKDHCGVICLDCGWIGVSYNRHDYKTCPCPNEAMVDGGYDYLRCGGVKLDRTQTFKLIPHES